MNDDYIQLIHRSSDTVILVPRDNNVLELRDNAIWKVVNEKAFWPGTEEERFKAVFKNRYIKMKDRKTGTKALVHFNGDSPGVLLGWERISE